MRRPHPTPSRSPALVAAVAMVLGLALPTRVLAQEEEKKGPPFAGDPDAPKVPPRPEMRTWTVVDGKFTYTFSFAPGIPKKDQMVEIRLAALEKPDAPDPKWGTTVPLIDARLTVEHRDPGGEPIRRYRLHPMPLAQGKYGLHLTPTETGIHELELAGTLADGREVSAELKLPVDVWPLPEELQGTGDPGGVARRRVIRRPVMKKVIEK